MDPENDTLTPSSADDLDEPYIHAVSTEEFVEEIERESRSENEDRPASHTDPGGEC
ncbi:hypothetical protein CLV58_1157 [Spirosoma oryzae]|uniref:Uncharacterized protein n=1 Tax=Spirosoma oryzae TaxID=1469603 RepID=A0A2T0SNF2_9BACT|nr:hypothetical protein CLV58_1157 [Spirosoma oryzae]